MAMNWKASDEAKPFMKITDAARYTGLSSYYFRTGVRNGTIPNIRSGNTIYINVPLFLQQQGINAEGADTVGK